jgi:site-specific recombinase XerD
MGGIRTTGSTEHRCLNESSYENGHEKISLNISGCYAFELCTMPSIHRQSGRPFWFCAFSIFNPETRANKRVFRSTKTRDRKQALEICRAWHKAALTARNGKLSVDAAREVIAQGVSDVFTAANVESLPSASIKSWCETWLQAKAIEAEASTHARYKRIIERFTGFLGEAKSNRDLSTLQASDIARFRDREAKERSRGTASLSVKVLRICFGEALRQGLLTINAAVRVPILKLRDKSARRAFTLPEIKRILKACGDDVEWRGLILFGLYLGQRLGDLTKLTWRAVNFETGEIAFTTRKTGRRIVLPLVQPLIDYLNALPAGDNPNAFIFPNSATHKRTASLSNQFRDILVEVKCGNHRKLKCGAASGSLHRLVRPLITEIHSRIWPSPRMTYL